MEDFSKVLRIGTAKTYGGRSYSVFVKVSYKDGRLSLTGVEGPTRGGDCIGSCGQIVMHDWNIASYAPGWNSRQETILRAVWNRWHLNDMKAGSAVQEDYLRDNPLKESEYGYALGKSYFVAVSEKLAQAGLNPDADGYCYGSAWMREEVTAEALDFLKGLPDADKQPAWI